MRSISFRKLIGIKDRARGLAECPLDLSGIGADNMLHPLEWNTAFSVGHTGLDAEHRDIMRSIGEIATFQANAADRIHLRSSLCALKEKVRVHFKHEDSILRQIAAASASAQKSRNVLAAMSEALLEEHIAGHVLDSGVLDKSIRETLTDSSACEPSIGETLTHWFVNHAVKHDAQLKTLFQSIEKDRPELFDTLLISTSSEPRGGNSGGMPRMEIAPVPVPSR